MQQVSHECESLTLKIEEYTGSIKSLEKEVMDASRVEHNILANIDYRGQLSRLDEAELQLNSMDIENAQTRKDEYQEKSRQLREAISSLTADHAGKIEKLNRSKIRYRD